MKIREFYNKSTNSKFDIIATFLTLLRRGKIDYCVIGGVGINAYCEPLLTLDFDCVIEKDKIKQLNAQLKTKGFKVKTHPFTYEITHVQSDVRIQIQRDDRYQKFLKGACYLEVLSYKMKVARREDLLYGKIWASRDRARNRLKREKDILDIRRLTTKFPKLKRLLDKKPI